MLNIQIYTGDVTTGFGLCRMGTTDCWNYLTSLGVQHHSWHDPVLAKGLVACAPLSKIPCIDIDEEDFFHPRYIIFL